MSVNKTKGLENMIKNIILFAMAMIMTASVAVAQNAPATKVAGSTPYYVSVLGGSQVGSPSGYDNSGIGKLAVGGYVVPGVKDARLELSGERIFGSEHGTLGNVSGNMFLATAAYDFTFVEKYIGVVPSVGPTVGYIALDTSRAVKSTNEDGFVYGVTANVAYRMTPAWSLVGEYQYLTSTEAEIYKRDGSSTAWTNQSVLGGVKYRF